MATRKASPQCNVKIPNVATYNSIHKALQPAAIKLYLIICRFIALLVCRQDKPREYTK